jgi:hypothetical protein
MKAKSLLLTVFVPVTGLTFLSLPAGAECWMTCPPGSTAAPNATGEQGATATAELVASPEELTPAQKPETTAKASPTPVPAKRKASPAPAAETMEPAASPEDNAAFQPAPAQAAAPAPVGGDRPEKMMQGELRCEGAEGVIINVAGKDYAVNDKAGPRYPPIQSIWNSATHPEADIERILSRGLTLCDR